MRKLFFLLIIVILSGCGIQLMVFHPSAANRKKPILIHVSHNPKSNIRKASRFSRIEYNAWLKQHKKENRKNEKKIDETFDNSLRPPHDKDGNPTRIIVLPDKFESNISPEIQNESEKVTNRHVDWIDKSDKVNLKRDKKIKSDLMNYYYPVRGEPFTATMLPFDISKFTSRHRPRVRKGVLFDNKRDKIKIPDKRKAKSRKKIK